jgi:hypothetical protein
MRVFVYILAHTCRWRIALRARPLRGYDPLTPVDISPGACVRVCACMRARVLLVCWSVCVCVCVCVSVCVCACVCMCVCMCVCVCVCVRYRRLCASVQGGAFMLAFYLAVPIVLGGVAFGTDAPALSRGYDSASAVARVARAHAHADTHTPTRTQSRPLSPTHAHARRQAPTHSPAHRRAQAHTHTRARVRTHANLQTRIHSHT